MGWGGVGTVGFRALNPKPFVISRASFQKRAFRQTCCNGTVTSLEGLGDASFRILFLFGVWWRVAEGGMWGLRVQL